MVHAKKSITRSVHHVITWAVITAVIGSIFRFLNSRESGCHGCDICGKKMAALVRT